MSFTEDELQSFNSILEQRFLAHQREMEHTLDKSMSEYRRELDQRFVDVKADLQRSVFQKLSDFQIRLETILGEKLNAQPARIMQTFNSDLDRRQQQFEGNIDHMLATHLQGIEQLVNQYATEYEQINKAGRTGIPVQQETIEVQTELPWEDLMEVMGKTLDDRLAMLNDAIQRSLKNLEQFLLVRLHSLRDEFALRNHSQKQGPQALYEDNPTSIQEILHGVEHLERIIESMQVAMTSNHALLSNRLYQHQQLPLERAHSTDHNRHIPDGVNKPFAITEEHVTNGLEPGGIPRQSEMEGQ